MGHRSYNLVYRQKHFYRTTPINSWKFKSLLGASYENRALSVMQNAKEMVKYLNFKFFKKKILKFLGSHGKNGSVTKTKGKLEKQYVHG